MLVDKKVFASSDVMFKKSDDTFVGRPERPVQDIIDFIAPCALPASPPSPVSSSASFLPSASPAMTLPDRIDVTDDVGIAEMSIVQPV